MDQDNNNDFEWTPIVLSFLLIVGCAAFSLYVVVLVFLSRKKAQVFTPGPVEKNDCDEEAPFCPNPILEWSGISCTYKTKKKDSQPAWTLSDSVGQLCVGELMAIMGPSGSGKTTLLDILAGRKETGEVTGSIRLLGRTMCAKSNKSGKVLQIISAYVPQELAFLPMQTPQEAVMFVSGLKHTHASLVEAHKILHDVGLSDPSLYTRPIGGILAGGLQIRGLSGGERKRLALACALAIDPRFIMLDEITSGLDSESALATIQLLKKLCHDRGVAAIVVIHQPDGYVFDCFDKLVLLSQGRCIFSGKLTRLGNFYRNRFNREIPVSNHEVPLDLLRRLKHIERKDEVQDIVMNTFNQSGPEEEETTPPGFLQIDLNNKVSFLRKLSIVFHRNLMNHYVRNVTNLLARLLVYSSCSLLDGAIFWQTGQYQDINLGSGAFSFIILITYLLPFNTIPIFINEKKLFLFERTLGLYSPWIYCISQIVLEAWLLILAAIIKTSIIIPMCGLWNPSISKWKSFLTYLSVMMSSGLTGSSIVLLFSILMPSQDLAFLCAACVMTVSLGVSGGYVPFPSMAKSVSWLQWLSPCKFSLQAFMIGYTVNSDKALYVQVLEFDKPGTVSANIGVLYVMFAALAIGTMFALHSKREVR